MSQYHIALCCDNNYLPYCFVACQSIIDSLDNINNNQLDKDTIVYHLIVDERVDVPSLTEKCDIFCKRNSIVKIEFNINHADNSLFQGAPKLKDSYSTYYRILIDSIVDKNISTILYLDVDILVRDDIRLLFKSTNLDEKVLAACVDSEINDTIIIKSRSVLKSDYQFSNNNYFNAGVLLINLDEWRRQDISSKCISILKTHKPAAHDQDLLNYLIKNKTIINVRWNFQILNFFLGFNKADKNYSYIPSRVNSTKEKMCNNALPSAKQLEQIAKDPSIIHFTYIKPWGPMDCFYSELPRVKNSSIFKFIEEWHNTAKKVTEFSDELSSLEYCQFVNYDFIDCLINHKVSVNQQNIDKLIKGRKKDKKALVSAIIVLLIMQIITFIILFFK